MLLATEPTLLLLISASTAVSGLVDRAIRLRPFRREGLARPDYALV
jgi:hypothetical protein